MLCADIAALIERLETDEQPSVIDRRLNPEAPTEEPRPATAGSASTTSIALLELLHRLERNVGRGLRATEDQSGIVLRELALGHLDIETDGERDGRRGTR